MIVEANLRDDGTDVDFFEFSDLPPGAAFSAEIVDRGDGLEVPPDAPRDVIFDSARLGQFDAQGNLIDEDDVRNRGTGSGRGPSEHSRLTGIVSDDGVVNLAVTGANDLDYDGLNDFFPKFDCGSGSDGHCLSGDYALVLEIAGTADNELLLDTGGADAIM